MRLIGVPPWLAASPRKSITGCCASSLIHGPGIFVQTNMYQLDAKRGGAPDRSTEPLTSGRVVRAGGRPSPRGIRAAGQRHQRSFSDHGAATTMASRIEDYALIGDLRDRRAGRARRLDRLALLAALRFRCLLRGAARQARARPLADRADGRAPCASRRRYRPDTLILETAFRDGRRRRRRSSTSCRRAARTPDLVRIVEGERGRVAMRHASSSCASTTARSCPGSRRIDDGTLRAHRRAGHGGACARRCRVRGEDLTTVGEFTVAAGESECRSC